MTKNRKSWASTLWADEDKAMLERYYVNTPDKEFSVLEIAAKLSRTEDAVVCMARRLGLTNKNRKANTAAKKKMSDSQREYAKKSEVGAIRSSRMKEWHAKNQHPKGMLGKVHNERTKALISQDLRKRWRDPTSSFNSDQHRQSLSDRMSILRSKSRSNNDYSNRKRGLRDDLGDTFFRSSWEANIARYLNWLKSKGLIYKWEYEPDTFWFEAIKRGVRSYTPDFKVWETDFAEPYYIEVKGWMDDKSKTKLKRMKKYHPKIRVDLYAERQYREIESKVGPLIRNWELPKKKAKTKRRSSR